jgi:coenzyme F420-reducing hydrogenase delta subunit
MTKKNWNPKIVAFVCNWCTYAGADLAGTSRLKYDASIRVLRVPCTGRIDTLFIVKAYEQGADCVLVSGCHPGDCHYDAGNYHARRRWTIFRELMSFLGIDDRRLQFSSVSAAEGVKWAKLINGLVEEIKSKGPFKAYQMLTR